MELCEPIRGFQPLHSEYDCQLQGRTLQPAFQHEHLSSDVGVNTPVEAMEIIRNQRFNGEVTNLEEQAISLVGKDIFEKLIKGYTEKQWGRDCKDLPSFIIRRLPVRLTYDNNYFNDPYQEFLLVDIIN